MDAASLDELRALFVGVPDILDGWETSPFYSVTLALEIAKRTDSQTEFSLRYVLYRGVPADAIPEAANDAIKLAVERYRSTRQINHGGRGL
jgi:hypothetical protein